jgi:hypothetical protein
MNSPLNIQLSELRKIGWDDWDPIGIRSVESADWKTCAADEYDSYLLQVVDLLRQGGQPKDAISYLDRVVTEHMGLGRLTDERHQASVKCVQAISDYLKALGREK